MTATVHVLCAGAVKHAFATLASLFERESGHAVRCSYAAVGTLLRQLSSGAAADLLVLSRPALEQLVREGKALAPPLDLATTGVGIGIRRGSIFPDISSVDGLRRTLLAARSLSYGDPARGDSSGVHFAKVLAQLGIEDAVAAKTTLAPAGLAVAELVRDGRVELGATQASVIAGCEGVDLAGLLPSAVQHFTRYACAAVRDGSAGAATQELMQYLRTTRAGELFAAAGFEKRFD